MIKISIITINYNNVIGLQKTLDSVFCQNFTNYEHIIVDGGSIDGSKEVIEFYSNKFSYWVSEKDSGIYNAMNKGIKQTRGEYLLFLNSGDYLCNKDSLKILLSDNNNEDLIYGNVFLNDGKTKLLKTYPIKLSFDYFTKDTLPHQATLIKKNLFSEVGYYNEYFKIVADWEFFLDAVCLHSCSYRHVSNTISVFMTDGISYNPDFKKLLIAENKIIYKTKYSAFIDDIIKLDKITSELNMYKISRIHKFISTIMNFKFSKKIKKLIKKK